MKPILLEVKNLSVSIEGEKILDNLSFVVREGEVLTILGPNGAGKSVLLRTLLGLLPYSGKIKWKKKVKIGYVPQPLPLIKDIPLSVEEFLKMKRADEKSIKEVLSLVGIEDPSILKKMVGDLSLGYFQRILIAFALIDNPQVLILDEATSGIDLGATETIYSFLEKLRKQRKLTILLVTHDLNVVYKFTSNVLCLNKRALCFGRPKNVTPEVLSNLYGGKIKIYEHTHEW